MNIDIFQQQPVLENERVLGSKRFAFLYLFAVRLYLVWKKFSSHRTKQALQIITTNLRLRSVGIGTVRV